MLMKGKDMKIVRESKLKTSLECSFPIFYREVGGSMAGSLNPHLHHLLQAAEKEGLLWQSKVGVISLHFVSILPVPHCNIKLLCKVYSLSFHGQRYRCNKFPPLQSCIFVICYFWRHYFIVCLESAVSRTEATASAFNNTPTVCSWLATVMVTEDCSFYLWWWTQC